MMSCCPVSFTRATLPPCLCSCNKAWLVCLVYPWVAERVWGGSFGFLRRRTDAFLNITCKSTEAYFYNCRIAGARVQSYSECCAYWPISTRHTRGGCEHSHHELAILHLSTCICDVHCQSIAMGSSILAVGCLHICPGV